MAEQRMKFVSRNTANWTRDAKVAGRVIAKGHEMIKDKDRNFINVLTSDGELRVFETEGLKDALAAADVGDFISIEHLGMVETSNGRDFRQFRVKVWEDPSAAPLTPAPQAPTPAGKRAARR